jgi:hypothetical protein
MVLGGGVEEAHAGFVGEEVHDFEGLHPGQPGGGLVAEVHDVFPIAVNVLDGPDIYFTFYTLAGGCIV